MGHQGALQGAGLEAALDLGRLELVAVAVPGAGGIAALIFVAIRPLFA